jgi:hypothetical protein
MSALKERHKVVLLLRGEADLARVVELDDFFERRRKIQRRRGPFRIASPSEADNRMASKLSSRGAIS